MHEAAQLPVTTLLLSVLAVLFIGLSKAGFGGGLGIKMPFFVANDIITSATLKTSALNFPLVPLGVWLGVWLNRRVPQTLFVRLIYLFTFLTRLQLMVMPQSGPATSSPLVAQTGSLPCRRLPSCKPADCQSTIRQVANRRYRRARLRHHDHPDHGTPQDL